MTINLDSTAGACTLWTNNWVYPSALGVYTGAVNAAGSYSGITFVNNTINCGGNVITTNLQCSATSSPNCSPF